MIKKLFGFLTILSAFAIHTATAQNLYVEPSIGTAVVNNVTSKAWTINKNLDQQYSLAIGKDLSKIFALEEQTTYVKSSDKSIVIETVNARLKVLPTVYIKAGAGVTGIPSAETYGFTYLAGVNFTGYKPFDLGVSVINAAKEGINNQLVVSAGIKID